MSQELRVAVLANHQHAGLAAALRALLPSASIWSTDLATLARDRVAREAAVLSVYRCTHVISQDAPSLYGALATTSLRAAGKPFALLPRFRFAGFHPDTVAVTLDGARLAGPTGATHSRIAIAGFLAGLTAAQTTDLFNGLVFGRLGYYAAYAEQHALLLAAFQAYGYDLTQHVEAWRHAGCFMLDAAHPRLRVLLDLSRLACARLGIVTENDTVHERELPPVPGPDATHPLFPEIAARLGVSPEGIFRGPRRPDRAAPLFSLDAYVRTSFAAYRRAPLAALRGVDGVPAALAALGLQEADFGRAAAHARLAEVSVPDDTVFLSWHGNLLGIETATGTLAQMAAWPVSDDSTEAVVRIVPVEAAIASDFAGGSQIAPGNAAGTVTLSQNGRYFSAPPRRITARFAAAEAGLSEQFMPLRRRDLALLRQLAGGTWQVAGGGVLVGATVRLLPGFVLAVGASRFDLGGVGLTVLDARGGLLLSYGEQTLTMRPARATETVDGIAVDAPADAWTLSEAASPEQFRHWPDHRLQLSGPDELLHLPLAVDDASRAWFYSACKEPHRLGRQTIAATAMRATGKLVLLSRGAEGSIVDAAGYWADGVSQNAALPAGVRRVAGGILLSSAALETAPSLTGRFCVFYTPRLAEWDDFLLRGALSLHILQPLLGPNTRLLLPPTLPDLAATAGFDHMDVLAAFGFGGMHALRTGGRLVRVPDVTWLPAANVSALPAFLLQSFRNRAFALHPPAAHNRRLYVQPATSRIANSAVVEAFLRGHNFEVVTPENLDPASQVAMFGAAEMIVAPHGAALANLLFCQAGTRVLELSPEAEFRPEFWQISEKLRLCHAVLPCPTTTGAWEGEMVVNMQRLRGIFRMLTSMRV